MNNLSEPDYTDLNLNLYKVPRPVLYQSTRGCYWNKCAFCIHTFSNKKYRVRKLESCLVDLKNLVTKYSPEFVIFIDLAIPAKRIKKISEWIIENKLKFKWFSFIRFDLDFDYEILKLMKEAGCDRLFFGLESYSEEVLKNINKGYNLKHVEKLIDDCYNLNIKLIVSTICGLPGESEKDALKTLNFLLKNKHKFHESLTHLFRLEKNCDIYTNPDKYNIKICENNKRFNNCIEFENGPEKLSESAANSLINKTVYKFYDDHPKAIFSRKSISSLNKLFKDPSIFEASCEFPFLNSKEKTIFKNKGLDIIEPKDNRTTRFDPKSVQCVKL